MSPAIGDIDLMGFYPSLSRDGAVVSGKPSDSNASVALITAKHLVKTSTKVSDFELVGIREPSFMVAFFVYMQEMVLGQPRGTYVIYKEETK